MGNKISFKAKQKEKQVLEVVKIDGKAISFTSPILVKDVVATLSGNGVGSSKGANLENILPLDYELQLGKVYYELPNYVANSVNSLSSISTTMSMSMSMGDKKPSGVKRVKLLITKRRLKELLAKQISVEEVIFELHKRASTFVVDRSSANLKANLESIPEEIE